MVFSSVITGVRDFLVTPSQAFLRTPNDPTRVGMGVAKGTLSLFSHSASGVFGFISKMSASAGQVVAVLSLDDEFQQWHSNVVVAEAKGLNRQWKRRGVQSVPKMVARPLYDIIRGLALGATGIVVNPYMGAKRRGCAGFAKGVAAGTVGIVAKPLVGVLDAFSHASGSVYDVAKSVNVLEKRYLPPKKLRLSYSFGPKGVLMPYDQVAARCVHFLATHPMKVSYDRVDKIRALGNEIHVASEVLPMEPGVESYVVASSHRIVLFQLKKESGGDIGTNLRWQVDLTRATSVSCKLQNQGHNGLALIISTTVPKKKVRIARGNQAQTSPERKRKAPTVGDTSAADETLRASQLSLHDSTSQVSAPLGRDDDEVHIGELLGTDVSDGPVVDNKREFEPKNNFHSSAKGKDGEVVEWYTIMAEYQQGRQLTRIHNAICCIIGDFGSVMSYRSGNGEGRTEGRTSFGELYFGKDPLQEVISTPRYDKVVCEDLNLLPWMYNSMFQTFKGKTPEKQQQMLLDTRDTWLLSREVSAALNDGAPVCLVEARARSTFIPHAPPPLPANIEDGDEVVSEILSQLKQGNITYDQACSLISSHAKSVMVSLTTEDGSDVSSVTEGNELGLDQLFSSAEDKDKSGRDVFYSMTPIYNSCRTPSEIGFPDANDRTPSHAASIPGDIYASRSSLPFLDAMDSRELQSLAEKSLELQSLTGKSLKSSHEDSLVRPGAPSSSLPLNASRGAPESMLASTRGHAPLRQRTESAPAGLVVPKSPRPPVLLNVSSEKIESLAPSLEYHPNDYWISQPDNLPDQSRLGRMESMLEQLIMMNARQLGQQDAYQTRARDEPEIIALRQEIAELRAQVQSVTTDGSRKEMIAALRKELNFLKKELSAERGKTVGLETELSAEKRMIEGGNEGTIMESQSEGGNVDTGGTSYRDPLNRARPAAVQFARGLEHGEHRCRDF